MDIEPIGNSVELNQVGNQLDVAVIDITTSSFFLTTLQVAIEHKEVGAIDND